MPIAIFGVNATEFNIPYVSVPNEPNWLTPEIIAQIAPDAEYIIIVPNKYPNLRDPSKIRLPPDGNIKIGSNYYSVCAVIITSTGQKDGHYYTITRQGRYNDVNVIINNKIMQHFLTDNYDVGDGGDAINGGHVYFFEKIASASSGGKKRGNKRIVATKRNDNNAGQSTTKRNTNHNIKTNRLTKRNNKHGVNVKRRFTKRKRQ